MTVPRNGSAAVWRIRADMGGTFTDCLAWSPRGELRRVKVLSTSTLRGVVGAVSRDGTLQLSGIELPDGSAAGLRLRRLGDAGRGVPVERYDGDARLLHLPASPAPRIEPGAAVEILSPEEAPVFATRLATDTPMDRPLPPLELRLATTRGTNALLERRGAPVAFFVTRGFGDLLRISTQQRPELFALDVHRPEPLHAHVVEVPERVAADGTVLTPLDPEALAPEIRRLRDLGVEACAIALLHADRHPGHERGVSTLLREAGFPHISPSSELAPSIGLLPRAETAVIDAYLSPAIKTFLEAVSAAVGSGPVHVMTSAGGLMRPADYHAKDSLLSGPAGGVAGAARAGRLSGFRKVIAFDMGGTSTDVARIDGDFEYLREHRVGDAHLVAPALAIETVAAGGGSVCAADLSGLRVGPESAGAHPGPACYGADGPLTVTDVNLLLGRLDPARLSIPVDAAAAEDALRTLVEELRASTGERPEHAPLLAGLLEIADERMADAIRRISVRKGYDPAEYALIAFGGAGAQHACGVAARLGMATVVVPADAGLLSAHGLEAARLERIAERQVLDDVNDVAESLPGWLDTLANDAIAAVCAEGVPPAEVEVRRRIADLRYRGQEATLSVEVEGGAPLRHAFEATYREVYGHRPEDRPVELVSLRVLAASREAPLPGLPSPDPSTPAPHGEQRPWTAGAWRTVPTYDRERLAPGARFAGPALVWEAHSATVVAAGWTAEVDAAAALVLSAGDDARLEAPGVPAAERRSGRAGERGNRHASRERAEADASSPDRPTAVTEELFTQRFAAVVGEMGEQLRRTALSVNIRERLDFSCALLDPDGELVANAPHIPVHLGAMGECVRRLREVIGMEPGDMVVTNHPAFGGSHLPDVTVVAPVHMEDGTPLGYLASRAHHAEIGGIRPGSMPPEATRLSDEGVVIPPTHLLRGGELHWEGVRRLLAGGPHPSRAVEDNLADLRAAVAANHRGSALLRALAEAHGVAAVHRHMEALSRRAERGIRRVLAGREDGSYHAVERLDDGTPLAVRVRIRGDGAEVDFAGSGGTHPGNLNATPAIVRSVVLYVLRLLLAEPLPLNEGVMRAVRLHTPRGILNPDFPDDPTHCVAVTGGNVETSQRLTDALLRALGLLAGSQGTMNNVLFGDRRFGYYETVGGGAGAGPGFEGASGTQVHMTNTRITDPEVLEHRYPVRLLRFAVRSGSGGSGRWRGGDGLIRELEFLAPVALSVLTQHRVEAPYGMHGGAPGAVGRQRVIRASGEVVPLAPIDGCEVEPGDRLILETPGGGGWGEAR